ncbi:MAG: hypothetical protein M1818_005422 [Claussenomyces sp. TS43310]|nr:MAG: hypothetical protein M1818_005422 [Claussenomyces sp. TS43310]
MSQIEDQIAADPEQRSSDGRRVLETARIQNTPLHSTDLAALDRNAQISEHGNQCNPARQRTLIEDTEHIMDSSTPGLEPAMIVEHNRLADSHGFQEAYQSIWGARQFRKTASTPRRSIFPRGSKDTFHIQSIQPKPGATLDPIVRSRRGVRSSQTLDGATPLRGNVPHRGRHEERGTWPFTLTEKPDRSQPRSLQCPSSYRISGSVEARVSRETALNLELSNHPRNGQSIGRPLIHVSQKQARNRRLTQFRICSRANQIWPVVRTKWRTTSCIHDQKYAWVASFWSTEFARLSIRYDKALRLKRSLRSFLGIGRYIIGSALVARKLHALKSSTSVMSQWLKYSAEERQLLWPSVMLCILDRHPTSSLKVLIGTHISPYPPNYAVSDSLEYIIDYYFHHPKEIAEEELAAILGMVCQILHQSPVPKVHMSQKSIALLLRYLDKFQAEELFSTLMDCGNPLHENTLLHFIDVWAKSGHTNMAVKALTELHAIGADFTMPKLESICATLLRKNHHNQELALPDSELFAYMLNLGLRPNIIFYNIILQNALSSGDSETGWRIHDMMLKNGVDADAFTYSILLNDAKHRMDHDAVNRIISITTAKNIIKNPYIATDLLHTRFLIYEHHVRSRKFGEKGPPGPFKSMLLMYSRCFDIEPLATIAPQEVEVYKQAIDHNATNPVYPSKETLTVMLIGLIRGFGDHRQAQRFYEHFRKLVLDGNPVIMPLVTSTHIYDAIIMALGRHTKTLSLCTQVVTDMLASSARLNSALASPEISAKELKGSERNPAPSLPFAGVSRHCEPSVRTWSVLLKSFFDNGQPRAAEKVLSLMHSRGIEPNQITWNSLVVGYARLQDVSNTASIVERMEGMGWEVDEVTLKGLQRIENRGALAKALEGASKRKRRRDEKSSEDVEEIAKLADTLKANTLKAAHSLGV